MKAFLHIILIVAFIFPANRLSAAFELQNDIRKSPIIGIPASTIQLQDSKYPSTGGTQFTNKQSTIKVQVGTDPAQLTYLLAPYSVTVTVEVNLYNLANTVASTQTETFKITYDGSPGAMEQAIQVAQYTGYLKFSARIVSMTDDATGNPMAVAPPNFYFYAEVMVERYYTFDPTITPFTAAGSLTHQFIDSDNDGIYDDVSILWNSVPGAESYDLEWTWVDNYGATPGTYKTAAQVGLTLRDFELNCTRVSAPNGSYLMPLLFDHGFLVYRVRARGKGGATFSEDVLGKWSTGNMLVTDKTVSKFPHFFQTVVQNSGGAVAEHDRNKNWQHRVSFAEDGKRKDLVDYFDGSLHERQKLTRLNSQKIVLAAETYYDYNGRPAVNALPAPTGAAALRFQPGFNRDIQGNIYGPKNFDMGASGCLLAADEMSNSTGTSRYYSPNNPLKNNWQDFVPDAEGFPFSQTQYTPDLTGRITAQSGVGVKHQLGSGHETRHFYGQPFQTELDRLFGYEAPYKTRCKKNTTVDANGQVSVAYLDAAGRTIATALAGAVPANLEPVSDEFGQTAQPPLATMRVDLLNKDLPGDPDDQQDDNLLFSTGLQGAINDGLQLNSNIIATTSNNAYKFDAKVIRGAFTQACIGTKCFPFVYDYALSLKDECGQELFSFGGSPATPLMKQLGTVDLSGANCGTITESWNATNGLLATLPIGSYTISKKLTVNGPAMDQYALKYIQFGQASGCIKTFQDFVNVQTSALHPEDCNTNCQKCVQELGPDNGTQAWKDNYKKCTEPCEPVSPCQVAYQTMLRDVSPGGQYGYTGTDPNEKLFSVFSDLSSSILPNINVANLWKLPVDEFNAPAFYPDYNNAKNFVRVLNIGTTTAPNYTPAISPGVIPAQLNGEEFVNPKDLLYLKDFLAIWRPEWAKQLVYYHPEKCYLDWCRGLQKKPTTPTPMSYSSEDFDNAMESAGSYSNAQSYVVGTTTLDLDETLNGTNWIDPFFQSGNVITYPTLAAYPSPGQAQIEFGNEIANYQLSGKTLKQYVMYLLECGTWYGSGTCTASVYPGSQPDKAWNTYKMLYQSAKQRIIAKYRDKYAISKNCYNDCMDNTNFNWLQYGFGFWSSPNWQGPFFSTPHPPCGWPLFYLYEKKKPRFIKKAGPYDITLPTNILYGQATGDLLNQYYQSTGRCLIDVDLEGLLNRMTADGNLLATNKPLFGIPEFTPGLYKAVSGIDIQKPSPPPFQPYTWNATAAGTVLTIKFTGSPAPCNQITLNLPASFTPTWATYGTAWKIVHWEQLVPNGGSYNFAVLARVDNDLANPSNPLLEVVLSGSTCIPVGGCQQAAKPSCKGSKLAEELLQLFNAMLADGKLNSASPVALTGLAYTAILDANSDIRNLLGIASPTPLQWQKKSGTQYALGNLLSGAPPAQQLNINLTTALPAIVNQFVSTEFTGIGKMKVNLSMSLTAGGTPVFTSTEMTLSTNHPVVPRECCFDMKLATGVAAMLSAFLGSPQHNILQYTNGNTSPFFTPGIAALVYGMGAGLNDQIVLNSVISNNIFTISIINNTTNKTLCSIQLNPVSSPAPANWQNMLVALSDIQPGSGPVQYPFTCTGKLNNGQTIALSGVSCFNFGGCAPCPPPTPPLPVSCNDAYAAYMADLTHIYGAGNIPPALTITEVVFCQNQYQYCAPGYINYLNLLGAGVFDKMILLSDFCQASSTTSKPCPQWHPQVQWPTPPPPDNPCEWFMQHLIQQNALSAYQQYIDDLIKDFKRQYIAAALATVVEELNVETPDQEYHYTLYYYDRAGNLVRTVPPRGVHPYKLAAPFSVSGSPATTVGNAIQYARQQRKQNLAPPNPHNYLSTYRYNSFNQLIRQETPDGGIATYWYDLKGRLVASQNGRQTPNQYSYTRFDSLGRTVEVGQLVSSAIPTEAFLNDPFYPNTWSTNRTEVTRTWYDATTGTGFAFPGTVPSPFPLGQENLRNRVVRMTLQDVYNANINTYDRATHYSYDPLGNVKIVVNENRQQGLVNLKQQYKRIEYNYDLISGKTNEVRYQPGEVDAYTQRFVYDDDNRLTNVFSSRDGVIWQADAAYNYTDHGPLGRMELGQDKVQGLDYAYTLQGWLKSVNANAVDPKADMGLDGWPDLSTSSGIYPHRQTGRDAYGFSLTYFNGDYKSRTGNNAFLTDIAAAPTLTQLWNGNIAQMVVALSDPTGHTLPLMANTYTYDQLNRIKTNQPRISPAAGAYNYTAAVHNTDYDESFKYDNNGNILTLDRNGPASGGNNSMDRFRYQYLDKSGAAFDPQTNNPINATNRLAYVKDLDINNNYDPDAGGPLIAPDLQNQSPGNYAYDAIGNLIQDLSAEIASITWTVYGKIRTITRTTGSKLPDLEFQYDPGGHRVAKIVKPRPTGVISPSIDWGYTWYVRDARGNPLATYTLQKVNSFPGGAPLQGLYLREQMLYGSSRLGLMRPNLLVAGGLTVNKSTYPTLIRGAKQYELTNHLGNVLATVSDRKLPAAGALMNVAVYSETFNSGTGGWAPNGTAVLSNASGRLRILGANGNDGNDGGSFKLPVLAGKNYILKFDLDLGTTLAAGGITVLLSQKTGATTTNLPITVAAGTNTFSFTGASESKLVMFQNSTASKYFFVDNLVLTLTGATNVGYYTGDVLGTWDYYAFGMDMVGRKFGGGVYRYGFNGKENDSEVEGADNFQDYGMRAYDVRVGRFVSVDPLTKKYPWYTPYQFAGNKPIQYIDLDGGEEKLKDKIKNDAAKKNDSKDKNLSPTMDPKSPLYIPPPDMSWLTNTTPAVPKNEGKTSPEKSNSLPVKVGEVGESISNMASLAEVAKIKGAGQLGGAGEGIAIGANTYIFITAPPGSEKKSAAGAQVVVDGVTYIASRAEPVIGEVLLAKDIIVISYEAFRSLPNSPEVQQALLEDAKRRSEKSYAAWKYYQELNRKLTPPHEINPQFVPGNQYNEY